MTWGQNWRCTEPVGHGVWAVQEDLEVLGVLQNAGRDTGSPDGLTCRL